MLYHHFAAKDDILDALLDETISAPLVLLDRLGDAAESAAVQLYALAWFDVHQLSAARWNLGALYLLPELRSERLAVEVVGDAASDAYTLPFRLVESAINVRSDEGAAPGEVDRMIPDAVLRMLGWSWDAAQVRETAAELLERLAAWSISARG
jgi:AcrR family transcriptional regulator